MSARCVCCGRSWPNPPTARADTGPIHWECWEEHHSDPTGEWPPGHICQSVKEATP